MEAMVLFSRSTVNFKSCCYRLYQLNTNKKIKSLENCFSNTGSEKINLRAHDCKLCLLPVQTQQRVLLELINHPSPCNIHLQPEISIDIFTAKTEGG